jgi:hypothetical protein
VGDSFRIEIISSSTFNDRDRLIRTSILTFLGNRQSVVNPKGDNSSNAYHANQYYSFTEFITYHIHHKNIELPSAKSQDDDFSANNK